MVEIFEFLELGWIFILKAVSDLEKCYQTKIGKWFLASQFCLCLTETVFSLKSFSVLKISILSP